MLTSEDLFNSESTTQARAAFLRSFELYRVDGAGTVIAITDFTDFKAIAEDVAYHGQPMIVSDREKLPSDIAALLVFPVYRDGEIISVVALAASGRDEAVGVFEIWEPVGACDDVRLASGYYPNLERFQNISTFVRFEKGIGLPGQVWQRQRSIVQDKLANHPGFLRAAGASADALDMGIGIPICDDSFVAAVVLLSSQWTPMARGLEVWVPDSDGFELIECSYAGGCAVYSLPLKTKLRLDEGLPGMAASLEAACVSTHKAVYAARREAAGGAKIHSGIAIPYYDGVTLTSVVVMLF